VSASGKNLETERIGFIVERFHNAGLIAVYTRIHNPGIIGEHLQYMPNHDIALDVKGDQVFLFQDAIKPDVGIYDRVPSGFYHDIDFGYRPRQFG
jgi:hypothetical protein